jgi:cytochrome b6-f complex iron-sulfur subunit
VDTGKVLLIAIPVVVVLAIVQAIVIGMSRRRETSAPLTREAVARDRSDVDIEPDLEARADAGDAGEDGRRRAEETLQALEPAGALPAPRLPGGLMAPGTAQIDPDVVGVTRRQFFNRGIVTTQVLGLGGLAAACLAFIWPSAGGGFGGKVKAGSLNEILGFIADKKQPFYVPEARAYINPYPKEALPKAETVFKDDVKRMGMDQGIVVLYQKCVHLGCRVPWCQTSQWFECPCHGSKYNRVGEKVGGPAPRGLDRWPAEIAGGQVTINTGGQPILGPAIGTNTTGQTAEGPHCIAL